MEVKKIHIIVGVIILSVLLFFFIKDKREKDLTQRGEIIIGRIEFFRKQNHRLPKELNEIGIIEEENSNAFYYDMRPLQNSSYNLSFLNIFCTFIV